MRWIENNDNDNKFVHIINFDKSKKFDLFNPSNVVIAKYEIEINQWIGTINVWTKEITKELYTKVIQHIKDKSLLTQNLKKISIQLLNNQTEEIKILSELGFIQELYLKEYIIKKDVKYDLIVLSIWLN